MEHAEVSRIIIELLEPFRAEGNCAPITGATRLQTDLALDSIDFTELLMRLEEMVEIDIQLGNLEGLEPIETVSDVVALLVRSATAS